MREIPVWFTREELDALECELPLTVQQAEALKMARRKIRQVRTRLEPEPLYGEELAGS